MQEAPSFGFLVFCWLSALAKCTTTGGTFLKQQKPEFFHRGFLGGRELAGKWQRRHEPLEKVPGETTE